MAISRPMMISEVSRRLSQTGTYAAATINLSPLDREGPNAHLAHVGQCHRPVREGRREDVIAVQFFATDRATSGT
jgi:hypothetical protein